jgi:hypothetical protein
VDFSVHRCGLLLGGIGFVGLLLCFVGEWRFGSAIFPPPAFASLAYFGFYSLVIMALLSLDNKPRPMLDKLRGHLAQPSAFSIWCTYRCSIPY